MTAPQPQRELLALVRCESCGLVESNLEAAVNIDSGGEWRSPCPRCGSVLREPVYRPEEVA